MIRIVNIVLVVLMLGAATWTYAVKHRAERNVAEINELERRIKLEKESIDLLQADWAYLSQPSRLKTLADQYGEQLQLQQTEPQQIVHPNELPAAPPLFKYERFDIKLDREWLRSNIGADVTQKELEVLAQLDRPEMVDRLLGLARQAARQQVHANLF